MRGSSYAPKSAEGAGSVTVTLQQLGSLLVWTGGICAAGGVALRVISFFHPGFAAFSAIAGIAGIGGAAVLGVGSSIQWLSDNPIVMFLGVVASIGGCVYWYWPRLYRHLRTRLAAKV